MPTTGQPVIATAGWPFKPASVRVFPLTHFDLNAAGEPLLVLHLELTDRWGDSVKAAGSLRVELAAPTRGTAASEETVLQWDVNLLNLDLNASRYDPTTATYRVPLEGLPRWAVQFARGRPGEAGSPAYARVRVRFTYVIADQDGNIVAELTRRDEEELRR